MQKIARQKKKQWDVYKYNLNVQDGLTGFQCLCESPPCGQSGQGGDDGHGDAEDDGHGGYYDVDDGHV